MAKATNLIVTPPDIARFRVSSAEPKLVQDMADTIAADVWVNDGATYPKYDEASNASQVYRRALCKALNLPVHQLKSRTWGLDGKGVVITDRTKSGVWRFALQLNPDGQPRERKTAGTE